MEIQVKDYGTIKVELDADTAPISVSNFINLVDLRLFCCLHRSVIIRDRRIFANFVNDLHSLCYRGRCDEAGRWRERDICGKKTPNANIFGDD